MMNMYFVESSLIKVDFIKKTPYKNAVGRELRSRRRGFKIGLIESNGSY
jgi:hypothetical protein